MYSNKTTLNSLYLFSRLMRAHFVVSSMSSVKVSRTDVMKVSQAVYCKRICRYAPALRAG